MKAIIKEQLPHLSPETTTSFATLVSETIELHALDISMCLESVSLEQAKQALTDSLLFDVGSMLTDDELGAHVGMSFSAPEFEFFLCDTIDIDSTGQEWSVDIDDNGWKEMEILVKVQPSSFEDRKSIRIERVQSLLDDMAKEKLEEAARVAARTCEFSIGLMF